MIINKMLSNGFVTLKKHCTHTKSELTHLIECIDDLMMETEISKIYKFKQTTECKEFRFMIAKTIDINDDDTLNNIGNEINIGLKVVNLPFLLGIDKNACYYEIIKIRPTIIRVYIVMKKMTSDLSSYLSDNKLPNYHILHQLLLINQIIQGVRQLHNKGILHLDLKPGNILMDGLFEMRIADFGFSKLGKPCTDKRMCRFYIETAEMVGTPCYLTPDHVLSRGNVCRLTDKTDVYILGMIIMRILSNSHNFELASVKNKLGEKVPTIYEMMVISSKEKNIKFFESNDNYMIHLFTPLLTSMTHDTPELRFDIESSYNTFIEIATDILADYNGYLASMSNYLFSKNLKNLGLFDLDNFVNMMLSSQIRRYDKDPDGRNAFIDNNKDYLKLLWDNSSISIQAQFPLVGQFFSNDVPHDLKIRTRNVVLPQTIYINPKKDKKERLIL